MDGCYEVYFGGKTIGKVQVRRQGLYLQFCCRCRLTGDVVCRLAVSCGGKTVSLGILVPMGDGFGLETKIPAKRLGQGVPEFRVLPNALTHREQFVPIAPEEPFAYLEKLKDAFLARQGGVLGAVIKCPAQAPRGSDPIPEPDCGSGYL